MAAHNHAFSTISQSDQELHVAVAAHKIHSAPRKEVPSVGTKIRKRFKDGWYSGELISQQKEKGKLRSYVLFEDGDQEDMSGKCEKRGLLCDRDLWHGVMLLVDLFV